MDEAVWDAWVLRGRAREVRSSAARLTAVQWGSAATLLAAAAIWSHLGNYAIVVNFAVLVGATMVALHCARTKNYAFAAIFAVLALIYNPVVPLIGFAGDTQRFVVLGSAALFIAEAFISRVPRKSSR